MEAIAPPSCVSPAVVFVPAAVVSAVCLALVAVAVVVASCVAANTLESFFFFGYVSLGRRSCRFCSPPHKLPPNVGDLSDISCPTFSLTTEALVVTLSSYRIPL